MEKNNFKNLLTDLYTNYNPASLQYVDDLTERYNRLEFDALKNIFIKYNRKNADYYDPEIGTDEYIFKIIKEYDSGKRTLENIVLKEQVPEKPETLEKKALLEGIKEFKDVQDEAKTEINKKIKEIDDSFLKKEKQFKSTLDGIYKDFEDRLEKLRKDVDDVTIRIFSTYTNSELELPNKRIIAGLGRGSRLVIKDADGKTVGMEIVDVTYDGVSEMDGKPLVEVFLEKI